MKWSVQSLVKWLEARDWDEGAILMVFGVAIGIVSGLGVVGFYGLIDLANWLFIRVPDSHATPLGQVLYRPLLTGAGIWAAWFVVRRSRIPEGQNVPDVQLAIAKRDGVIKPQPVVVRTVASALTLGSGGSAGSEGPVAVLGAAVGSLLGRRLRFQARHLKILVGCGAAAGIAGAFNAPFAGAFFALEEILGSFSVGAFSPVVIASVIGALTARAFLGEHPIFETAMPANATPFESLVLYPVLGVLCGLVSAVYARAYLAAQDRGARVKGPRWLWPILAGIVVGLIAIASGGLLAGNGHLAIPAPIFGNLAWYALLAITAGKIAATVITLGFGGSGGVFTPTLFIGASLGGGLGVLAQRIIPGDIVHPHAWAFVGMAGLIAGATRAPLTAIFIVFEMTDDYTYVVPLIIVAVIAFVTAKRYAPHGLYDGWLDAHGEHLAHGVDQAIMDHLHVSDVVDGSVQAVNAGATIDDLIAAAALTKYGVLPVVQNDGTLVGVVTHHALRQAILARQELGTLVVAADIADVVDAVAPSDSLRRALAAMNARGVDALPVVDERLDGQRFTGLLGRRDVLLLYEQALAKAV